ncbi:MAG TPA: hypothetical protein VIF15_11740 [Polyangiaceae bacterium]
MASTARALAILAAIGLFPAIALAQSTVTTAPAAPPSPPAATDTPAGTTAPGDTAAPSGSARVVVPATGYGWSTTPKKKATTRVRALRVKVQTPDAILPGFETLADGSTRLFVELSKPVPYETKVAPGTLTYVLKGAHVDRRNNFNPLVTVHFNTPVTSARLAPHGKDLWFVVDLRASVQPNVVMDAAKDGAAMLRIEFPKGDYLPAQAHVPAAAPAGSPAATPSPAASSQPLHPAQL